MRRAYITAVASVAVLVAGAASVARAAPGTAPFACNAGRGVTCFFKLFLGPRYTRIVELPSGMTANIPSVDIGSDKYCVSNNRRPLPTCQRTVIKATLNH
jgi:hypothetical protein